MEKYLFKSNIFAQLSEIVEADSEKEVWNKIRNRTSFEIKQKALQVYPASIEIRKIKEKKEKNNMVKFNEVTSSESEKLGAGTHTVKIAKVKETKKDDQKADKK